MICVLRPLCLAGLGLIILASNLPLAGEEAEIGLAAGKQAPFFVIDFSHGEHKDHGGCPSVIIANHETRGIIIIAREASDAALKLAKTLDGETVDGKHVLGFLVVPGASGKELAVACEKSALKSWNAGIPRQQSLETLKRFDLTDDTAVAVLLLDRKAVKSAHLLKAGELKPEKQKEIVTEANKFAEGATKQ